MTNNELKDEIENWIIGNWRLRESKLKYRFSKSQLEDHKGTSDKYSEESVADSYERAKEFMKLLALDENDPVYEGFDGMYVVCVTHAFYLKRIGMLSQSLNFMKAEIKNCSFTSLRLASKDGDDKDDEKNKEMEIVGQMGMQNF